MTQGDKLLKLADASAPDRDMVVGWLDDRTLVLEIGDRPIEGGLAARLAGKAGAAAELTAALDRVHVDGDLWAAAALSPEMRNVRDAEKLLGGAPSAAWASIELDDPVRVRAGARFADPGTARSAADRLSSTGPQLMPPGSDHFDAKADGRNVDVSATIPGSIVKKVLGHGQPGPPPAPPPPPVPPSKAPPVAQAPTSPRPADGPPLAVALFADGDLELALGDHITRVSSISDLPGALAAYPDAGPRAEITLFSKPGPALDALVALSAMPGSRGSTPGCRQAPPPPPGAGLECTARMPLLCCRVRAERPPAPGRGSLMHRCAAIVAIALQACGGNEPRAGHRPRTTIPLAARVATATVSVAPARVGLPNIFLSGYAFAVPAAPGVVLGWNAGADAHLTPLGADLARRGNDRVLAGEVLVALHGLPDGDVVAALTPYDTALANAFHGARRLDVVRFHGDRVRFRTRVVGGEGTGAGAVWFAWSPTRGAAIADEGDHIGVYVAVSRNFGNATSPNVHQGDMFVALDGRGAIVDRQLWGASHSNLLAITARPGGGFVTATVGDAYPFGLQIYDRQTRRESVVWPPAEKRTAAVANSARDTVGAGHLCGLAMVGGHVLLAAGTSHTVPFDGSRDRADVLVLAGGHPHWLTSTPDTSELCPRLVGYGGGAMVAWPAGKRGGATLATIDADGRITDGPAATNAPLDESFALAQPMPGGGVVWAVAGLGADHLDVVRVAPP